MLLTRAGAGLADPALAQSRGSMFLMALIGPLTIAHPLDSLEARSASAGPTNQAARGSLAPRRSPILFALPDPLPEAPASVAAGLRLAI